MLPVTRFYYYSPIASAATVCLQGQFLGDFFAQNFHQFFLVQLLAHLLPSAVLHLYALGKSSEPKVVNSPDIS